MQLRDGRTKSTATLNEAAAFNAPEGASKKDKSLSFMNKDPPQLIRKQTIKKKDSKVVY
jgi:hypothetical protein